jgi:regulator of protease activity HflC (stomatin/prohibitin superfamily)
MTACALFELKAALEGVDGTQGEAAVEFWAKAFEYIKSTVTTFARENAYLVFLAVWGLIRAMGTTVETGNTGLFFSFGRATRVLQPGFVLKIPYFHQVRTLPTRSRTMDVPHQKVTSRDGLVWFVDVNLVYRVVDVRKALIEVDDLDHGMEQMLSLSVQEIVRSCGRESLRGSGELDPQLASKMQARLEPWGVEIESAGFTSVKPSPKTLKFTQQLHATRERHRMLEQLEDRGLNHGLALAMLGSPPLLQRRFVRARRREERSRHKRRLLEVVQRTERGRQQEVSRPLRRRIRDRLVTDL